MTKAPIAESWDAKQFANVRPLHCQSIWHIPTTRDPDPDPPAQKPNPQAVKVIKFSPDDKTALPTVQVTKQPETQQLTRHMCCSAKALWISLRVVHPRRSHDSNGG